MKKKILSPIIFILLIVHYSHISGQGRWVNSYHENEDVVILSVKESYDKGYLLSGKHGPNYSKYNWLLKTDINGELLWEKTIGNGVNSIALLDMEQDDSGNIYLGGSTKAYDSQGDPLILKLNPCGEKEWCRIFYTENNHDFASCFTLTPQEDITVVLLLTNPEAWVERICLAKLSRDGELIWKQCYTTSDTSQRNEEVYDIMMTPDSGFLLTGDCYYEDPTIPNKWWLHPYYLKVDSLGNFEWETVIYQDTELEGGNAFSTVISPDSQFFYSSSRHNYHEEDLSSPSLLKLDLQGNLVSVHDIVYGYKEGKLTDAQFINDSTLAASSGWGNSDDDLWSRAVIIDTLGSLLNSTVLIPDFFTSFLSLAYDGKLVYCSNELVDDQFNVYLTKLNQDLGQDSIYTRIFTYDSLCPYSIVSDTIVQDDCGLIVGIEEEEVKGGQGEEGKRGRLEVWPNPGSGIVNCQLSIVNCRGELMIYDVFGREVDEIKVPDEQNTIKINVESYPPGVYIVILKKGVDLLESSKFVIAR